jgi:hypothetical protein
MLSLSLCVSSLSFLYVVCKDKRAEVMNVISISLSIASSDGPHRDAAVLYVTS